MQTTFPDIYKKLFSENEVVISGHFWFNWFPSGIGQYTDFISIRQKIHSKCYLGIRKVSQVGISFDEILMFDGEQFVPYPHENITLYYEKTLHYLEEKLGLDKLGYGFRISGIAERSRWEGVGFTGTLFSLLTFGIEMMIGKVKADQLLEYEYFMTTPQFKEIKDIAHTCAWMVKRGNPGAAFLTTLLQSPHPHLYLLEVAKEMKADDIPFLESYEKTIPELLHLGDNNIFPTLPLRWAMIYSGNKANTLSVEKQRVLLKSQNKNYSEWFLQQDFGKVHSHLHELFANQDYYNVMENGMEEMSIKLVYMFTEIYKQGPRKEHIQLLIHTLNTLHHLYNTVEEDSDFYDEFLEICTQQGIPPTKFWISPIYSSKHGGNYIVVFDEESDLDALKEIIQTMQETRPSCHIADHYDWDTPPFEGIQIEQNLYQLKKSDQAGDSYLLLNNAGEQKFIAYTDIDPSETKGLFLDAIRGKVYINGTQQTSKEIKSQTTTIEIFEQLFTNNGKIRNNQLWPSTFSGQQNQMLGKIIYPLNKLMKIAMGKEFPLESSGSLREFYITLGKTDIPIVLIKKI